MSTNHRGSLAIPCTQRFYSAFHTLRGIRHCLGVYGQFQLASWLVLWGVLLVARRWLRLSCNLEFGVQYDSFADFVVFGLAPAAILFFALGRTSSGELNLLPTIVAALLIVANSAQLAFNVSDTALAYLLAY